MVKSHILTSLIAFSLASSATAGLALERNTTQDSLIDEKLSIKTVQLPYLSSNLTFSKTKEARAFKAYSETEFNFSFGRGEIVAAKVPQSDKQKNCLEKEDFEVEGSTIFQKEICDIVKRYGEKVLTKAEQNDLRDEITKLYLQNGYITSRAESVTADFDKIALKQHIKVSIIEGILEENDVVVQDGDSASSISKNLGLKEFVLLQLQPVISTKSKRRVLNVDKLEQQLRLLKYSALFGSNIKSFLRKGDEKGHSKLVVEIDETVFNLSLGVNNNAPPSTGAERIELGLYVANPLGAISPNNDDFGDELAASLEFKPALSEAAKKDIKKAPLSLLEAARIEYRLPLGSARDLLIINGEFNDNEILQKPFNVSNFKSQYWLVGMGYRHLLNPTFENELYLTAGFTFQKGQTFVFNTVGFPFGFGPDDDGVSRTSVFSIGLNNIRRDNTGRWLLALRMKWGTGLLDATRNSGSVPDGQFISFLGQFQRVQSLNSNQLLVAQFDFQLTPNSLLPSQQFTIGGIQSLRGYRSNVRTGDNGLRFSIEDRITIKWANNPKTLIQEPVIQIIPFADIGTVWNHSGNPNKLPEQTLLPSLGLGLFWQPIPNIELRLDYAFPLVNLRDRGENLQDKGLYFRVNYNIL